jgi:hypothetical protein
MRTLENPVGIKDELKQQRRNKIADVFKARFEEKSLQERLAKIPTTANVLREGFLGFLPDETLLTDIYPQGEGNRTSDKITFDPLWEHVLEFLNNRQRVDTVSMFKAIEQFAPRLEDETQIEKRATQLKHNHLITLFDIRQVPLEGWLALDYLGKGRANLIFEAAKKIE